MLELHNFNSLVDEGRLREAFVAGGLCELMWTPLSLDEGEPRDPSAWTAFFRKFMALHAAVLEHENARYLWRRSTRRIREDVEFEALWNVNKCALMNSSTSAMQILLNTSWSHDVQPLVDICTRVFQENKWRCLSGIYGVKASVQARQLLQLQSEPEDVWRFDEEFISQASSSSLVSLQGSDRNVQPLSPSFMNDMAEYVTYVVRKPLSIDLKSSDKKSNKTAGTTDPMRK